MGAHTSGLRGLQHRSDSQEGLTCSGNTFCGMGECRGISAGLCCVFHVWDTALSVQLYPRSYLDLGGCNVIIISIVGLGQAAIEFQIWAQPLFVTETRSQSEWRSRCLRSGRSRLEVKRKHASLPCRLLLTV